MRPLVMAAVWLICACGPNAGGNGDGDKNDDNCGQCPEDQVCVADLGCADCIPGGLTCVEDEVWECGADGTTSDLVEICGERELCHGGQCLPACDVAAEEHSNVGCEYWAVDLDNEYSDFNDAAGEQFAVAIANTSNFSVDVVIEQNNANPGQPLALSVVTQHTVPAHDLAVINLPTREVDGSLNGQGEGPGTMLSSRAYRVTTNFPVVAYQFNPIVQSFSNGASLLIPTPALDDDYWVLGWPTANPIAGPISLPGIPDHSFVTIVGVTDQPIDVEVSLGGPIVGGGGIAAQPSGGTVQATLKAFDVLNLESDGIPGDMTGTKVVSLGGPVAVFSGGERAIVPIDVKPPAPSNWNGDSCCTEHFEQQVFPTVSLGKEFVVTRSPIRSQSASNPEGDVYRILATEPNTSVTTNLPSPYDQFSLQTGEYAEFWSIQDFVVSSNQPIMLAQYLVSQDYVESPDVGGDPEFILFPPAEQHRDDYIFLAPPTFERDWVIIAAPETAVVQLDGEDLQDEFDPLCTRHPAGVVAGDSYVAIRCPISDGVHRVTANKKVGVTVYGYYNVGSYGYAAGAELKRINID